MNQEEQIAESERIAAEWEKLCMEREEKLAHAASIELYEMGWEYNIIQIGRIIAAWKEAGIHVAPNARALALAIAETH